MAKFLKRKIIKKEDVDKHAQEYGLDKLLVEALLMRDILPKDFKKFLAPTIDQLSELPIQIYEISQRVKLAIENKEKIVIFGDYDCDGICAVSILVKFLRSVGVDIDYFIPNRFTNGYGLSISGLEYIAERFFPDLIITVDCGISAVEEVEYCREVLGIDIVVTDHHNAPQNLPDCLIFDPKTIDISEGKPDFYDICGAGVALRLVEALSSREIMLKYVDICAIATVGDVVALTGDNRIICALGIKKLQQGDCPKGVALLLEKLKISDISSETLAFSVVPKINSLGRMFDANQVVDLFVGDDHFTIDTITDKIISTNELRQEYTQDVYDDCVEQLKKDNKLSNKILILHSDLWHEGVLGIVAARLCDTFCRPAILFTSAKEDGKIKGSCRSTELIDVYKILAKHKSFLSSFGGHSFACGLSMAKENLDLFCSTVYSFLEKNYGDECFVSADKFDFERSSFPTLKEVELLDLLQPCGEGNQSVKYKIDVTECAFVRISDKDHIKYQVTKDCSVLAFNQFGRINLYNSDLPKSFLLNFERKVYKNAVFAQAIVNKVGFCDNLGDDELFFGDYAKQLFRKGECAFDLCKTKIDKCTDFAKTSLYGTVFLCYTVRSFKLICNKLRENGCVFETAVNYFGGSSQNTVFLSPELSADLTIFDNIVFLDPPLCDAYINYLKLKPTTNILVCDDNIATNEFLRSSLCDYKSLGEVFLLIRKELSANKHNNLMYLCSSLSKKTGVIASKIYMSFFVFFDLKIIKFEKDGTIFIDKTVVSKLDCSEFYKRYCQAFGK